jgi:hypothetical protein
MSLPGKKFDPYHRFIYGSMDCFIAITQYIARQAETNLPIPKDKIQQIYNGVDASPNVDVETTARLKKKFSINDEFVVGLVGRVTGLLFESWNANSLAEALKRLYTDRELWNKIAIMGRQKARKKFDAKIQYQKVFQTMYGSFYHKRQSQRYLG